MPLKPCRSCNRLSADALCPLCTSAQERTRTAERAIQEPWRAIYGSAEWKRTQRAVVLRDGGCKAIREGRECGSRNALAAHHIKPLSQGGEPFDMDNLVALCLECHPKIEKATREQPTI